jgi:hypothetical protein
MITRRQFLGGISLAPTGFIMPGWLKRLAMWFAPEEKILTRVRVPTFEIVSNPTISFADIKARRFKFKMGL